MDPFWMDIYPVTVAQYARYLENPSAEAKDFGMIPSANGPEQPVVGVSG